MTETELRAAVRAMLDGIEAEKAEAPPPPQWQIDWHNRFLAHAPREKQEALETGALCGCHSEEAQSLDCGWWHYVMGQCVGPYSQERQWGDPLDITPAQPVVLAVDAIHAARKRHPIEWVL